MNNKIFVDGMIFKNPHENAPDFIKGRISIKVKALIDFLSKQTGEWIDVDLKESKGGKLYFELNTFKKSTPAEIPTEVPPQETVTTDLPF